MKDNANSRPTRKKKLLFWLILAACLLIVAAITVGVIFAVNGNGRNMTLDSGTVEGGGQQEPPDSGDDDPGADTSSQYEFISPVKDVNVICAHVFAHNKTLDKYYLHQAIDFGAPAGTEVLAAVDGKVLSIEKDDKLVYATVTIEHAGGVTTVYKFIEPAESLVAGAAVTRGQVIGAIAAATGIENADGDHLHFEVFKDGVNVDPEDYLEIDPK